MTLKKNEIKNNKSIEKQELIKKDERKAKDISNKNNGSNKQMTAEIVSKNINQEKKLDEINESKEAKEPKKATVGGIISTVFFYILLAILIVIVGFLIFGYRPAIVLSGSMRPSIQPGDVTVYHKVDISELKVGDIIMFSGKDAGSDNATITNVTHRIIALPTEEESFFITHGDANSEGSNEKIEASQIQGRVEFWIPWIGIPLNFVRNNMLAFLFGAMSLIVLSYIISIIKKAKIEEKDKEHPTGL